MVDGEASIAMKESVMNAVKEMAINALFPVDASVQMDSEANAVTSQIQALYLMQPRFTSTTHPLQMPHWPLVWQAVLQSEVGMVDHSS